MYDSPSLVCGVNKHERKMTDDFKLKGRKMYVHK